MAEEKNSRTDAVHVSGEALFEKRDLSFAGLPERYALKREIGRGGMSVVFLAGDRMTGKDVAVKIMTGNVSCSKAAEGLRHPALAKIYEVHEHCVVMEYVEGMTLAEALRLHGPFSEKEARSFARILAEALAYLHGQDPPVIYRDMKPSNIMLGRGGKLKLIDFGIAREYKADARGDTVILGTDGYAAPEQHGLSQSGARSDLYSLGATLLELYTGVPPGRDPERYRQHHLCAAYGCSVSWEYILNRCLAFDPQQRYASCGELLKDLGCPEEVLRWRLSGSRKQRRKLVVTAGLSLLLAAAGIFCDAAAASAGQRFFEEEVDSVTEEAERCGCLTEEGDERIRQAFYLWNREADAAYAERCLETGLLYFYLYSGGDGSFRNRIYLAEPYFEKAAEAFRVAGNTEEDLRKEETVPERAGQAGDAAERAGQAEAAAERAGRYLEVCRFCRVFLYSSLTAEEPDQEDCEELLQAADGILEETGLWTGRTAGTERLIFFTELIDLLRENCGSFAAAGTGREQIAMLLAKIRTAAEDMTVSGRESLELREKLLEQLEETEEKTERIFNDRRRDYDADDR